MLLINPGDLCKINFLEITFLGLFIKKSGSKYKILDLDYFELEYWSENHIKVIQHYEEKK